MMESMKLNATDIQELVARPRDRASLTQEYWRQLQAGEDIGSLGLFAVVKVPTTGELKYLGDCTWAEIEALHRQSVEQLAAANAELNELGEALMVRRRDGV